MVGPIVAIISGGLTVEAREAIARTRGGYVNQMLVSQRLDWKEIGPSHRGCGDDASGDPAKPR